MRMHEAGLLDVWWSLFSADASYCLRKINQEINNKVGGDVKKPLTVKGLSGSFTILGVGCLAAITVFIFEFCKWKLEKYCQGKIEGIKNHAAKKTNKTENKEKMLKRIEEVDRTQSTVTADSVINLIDNTDDDLMVECKLPNKDDIVNADN